MKIGQEMWKMRTELKRGPYVKCYLTYIDFHENHNTEQYCVEIYTVSAKFKVHGMYG